MRPLKGCATGVNPGCVERELASDAVTAPAVIKPWYCGCRLPARGGFAGKAAKEEIEQVFGGGRVRGKRNEAGSHKTCEIAAALRTLKGQISTQRSLHPTQHKLSAEPALCRESN